MAELFHNDLFVITLAALAGLLLGRIRVKGIALGLSGALFAGLVFGACGLSVSKAYFHWNLLFFVVSIGLVAGEEMPAMLRRFGWRLAALSILVTGTGALACGACNLLLSLGPDLTAGIFTGALTSSPGLGAAMEVSRGSPLATAGYLISYPFGVVSVVLFVQLAPLIFRIDVTREREELSLADDSPSASLPSHREPLFSLLDFLLAMTVGMLAGEVQLPLPGGSALSLGATGGALLASLAISAWRGKAGKTDRRVLGVIRDLSVIFFLAASGLLAGPRFLEVLAAQGPMVFVSGVVTALAALLSGFLVGRRLWRMNWVLLAGALCGAMTSTPGLGAAIDATKSEECAVGYAATYPVALFCMVLFTTWLY